MKQLDPIIESALGNRSRLSRAIVFLDRAAWLLDEAHKSSLPQAEDDPVEEINYTIEILRGATANAAHDLAVFLCAREK